MTEKCEICGKFHKSGCWYCSKECCMVHADNMAAAYGGSFEDANAEVESICGECVF